MIGSDGLRRIFSRIVKASRCLGFEHSATQGEYGLLPRAGDVGLPIAGADLEIVLGQP